MTGKILTISQRKGGSGKTTLAANLAVAWHENGRSVVLVDTDPQQSLTMWAGLRPAAENAVAVETIDGWQIEREARRLANRYDIVIVDSPPHDELETNLAVRAATLVLIPVQPTPMDVWATERTLAQAAEEDAKALAVLNRVPPRANLTEEMAAKLSEMGCQAAKSRIGNRVAFASAFAEGKAVIEAQPRGRAADEIRALAREVQRALK